MFHLSLAPHSFGFDIEYRDHLPRSLEMHTHDFCEMVWYMALFNEDISTIRYEHPRISKDECRALADIAGKAAE